MSPDTELTEEEQAEKVLQGIKDLKDDYTRLFLGEKNLTGQRVLEDLKLRCFAKATTHDPTDPQAIFINEGRRQVWLYIQTVLESDIPTIQELMGGQEEEYLP